MSKLLTIIYAYYDNPKMFIRQQLEWIKYPTDICKKVKFIVVDDCSPKWAAEKKYKYLDMKIFRMKQDIPWNMDACRNLAVSQTKTKWIFLSDMDHVLPVISIKKILEKINDLHMDQDYFYTFTRVDAPDLTEYKDHPNTYLMTRGLYDKVGGYDETFAGFYGTDGHFRRALKHYSKGYHRLDISIVRYPREVISDASTTSLDRKKGRDTERGGKYRKKALRDLQDGTRPKTLSFQWEQIC